ncbi:TPA: phosphoribosylformylglycinamidine synthase subunit PurQ [Streptococcus pyogenes]|nr:phosphoribosylformylglycinamidine synthase subunit PurQ [Streptococcus pyogenes]
MNKRIFVEKKADFGIKSASLVKELTHNLQLTSLKALRIVQVYDVFNLAEDLLARAEKHIFSEQVTDCLLTETEITAELDKVAFFAIESLPGQFDQRAVSSQEALLLFGSDSQVKVNTAQLYLVNKDIAEAELEAVKNYLLNPVDSRFKDITLPLEEQAFSVSDKTIPNLDFFETYKADDFTAYKVEQGLAMEVDDLLFIQDYFKSIGRVPTETELKVLDTYWSDHCRHTTFETELKNIDFSASKFQKQLQTTYDKYIAMRDELGRSEKPQTLMDMATIFGRYERANGRLDDMEVSDEINACSAETLEADTLKVLSDLNHASQKGLQTIFDSSVGRSTVNHPIGGRYQITPTESSVQKLPVQHGVTTTASVMAQGYNAYIAEWSPYHGAAYAVIEATARLVATGADWSRARFSYQEYFERMDKQAERFGQPVSALLGSIEAQIQLGLPSIGGKDSMSGTFEDLTVPPTLVAFGVTTADSRKILSPEFKAAGENIYYIPGQAISEDIDFDLIKANFSQFEAIQTQHKITAASAVKYGGVLESFALMTFGNRIGASVEIAELDSSLTAQLGGFVFTSAEEIADAVKIGQTQADFTVTVNGNDLAGASLLAAFEGKLEEVYPTEFEQTDVLEEVPAVVSDTVIKAKETIEKPVVYIPVFPGTNSEYDSAKAFEQVGASVNLVPFVTLNEVAIAESVDTMVANIAKANIIFFAGGFSAADEPDGSAKFIVNILLNEKVRAAIDSFIEKGGLIIGICNGFQALVKSGLLPYGNFEEAGETSPTLFYNDANQHVAKMVETRIANTNSPWLAGVEVGDIHAIPVSHGEGKFVVSASEFAELRDNGQIWSQYVDFDGQPSMDSKYNPNGSVNAIEGITSKNGQIIGKMGHSERWEDGLFQNIPGNKDQTLFASAVKYFTGK